MSSDSGPNEKLALAVEVLVEELNSQIREVAETKKMINSLRRRMGEEPMFEDVEAEQVAASGSIRPDQYYGKPLSTAAREYLERRRQACSAEEILRGLEQGGFDFESQGWKEKDRLRSFSMTLAKNSSIFHRLPNGSFGLLLWYDAKAIKKADKPNLKDTDEEKLAPDSSHTPQPA